MTRLTTKPDCSSRFSTLQSAHWPVRGQTAEVGAPVVPASGVDGLTTSAVVAVEDAVGALSDAERVHAARGTEASRSRPGSFFIKFKDRASARAPRLLILEGFTGGQMSTMQRIRVLALHRFYGTYLNNSQVQLRQFD